MIKKRIIMFPALILAVLIALACPKAQLLSSAGQQVKAERYNAKSALLMDYNTGEILLEQNASERLPIASMVKIMTLNLIFEAQESGKLDLSQKITVSQNASSMGGSQAFLDANAQYSADELVKSIIVASANDSCVAMAEHLAGDVEQFVSMMNQKAKELRLENTNFVNCTGLPADGQYSCAKDAAIMFRQLAGHKKFFDYSKIWMYDIVHAGGRTTSLTNTNKLVRFYNGCDGGKTGFTKEALSCLAATAVRGDTRLISVIIAAPDAKQRNAEVSKLFNYGFASFETKKVVGEQTEIKEQALVEGGKSDSVALMPQGSYYHLVKKGEKAELSHTVTVNKVKAPIKKGDVAGKINVLLNGQSIAEINLVACADVKKASYLDMVNRMIEQW